MIGSPAPSPFTDHSKELERLRTMDERTQRMRAQEIIDAQCVDIDRLREENERMKAERLAMKVRIEKDMEPEIKRLQSLAVSTSEGRTSFYYKEAFEAMRAERDKLKLSLSIAHDHLKDAHDMEDKANAERDAAIKRINDCIEYAGNHYFDWGDRAVKCNEICNSLKRWVEFMYDQPDVDRMVITISKHDLSGYKIVYDIQQKQGQADEKTD